MKKILLLTALLSVCVTLFAQVDGTVKKNGYIGLNTGPSLPVGEFGDNCAEIGVQLNIINFGYFFSDNIGIAASCFGGIYSIDNKGNDTKSWKLGSILVGPLFSIPLTDSVDWDWRPSFGLGITNLTDSGSSSSLALNLGTTVRFNIRHNIAFLLNADYYSTKAKNIKISDNFNQKVKTLTLSFGIAYRF